jgi:cephalosporin hydroxylase
VCLLAFQEEMEAYCPLVSVGYYCIVEDTKMSRWSSTGPLEAVERFLAKHPEFILVRL